MPSRERRCRKLTWEEKSRACLGGIDPEELCVGPLAHEHGCVEGVVGQGDVVLVLCLPGDLQVRRQVPPGLSDDAAVRLGGEDLDTRGWRALEGAAGGAELGGEGVAEAGLPRDSIICIGL
eukprot:scaffold34898_cov31-Prasinocladus_malaysianus.AAC.1